MRARVGTGACGLLAAALACRGTPPPAAPSPEAAFRDAVAQLQAESRATLARMAAEPWLRDGPWTTDYDAARESAATSGRLIFAYFTRAFAP